jgi:hypothetical protein
MLISWSRTHRLPVGNNLDYKPPASLVEQDVPPYRGLLALAVMEDHRPTKIQPALSLEILVWSKVAQKFS